MQMLNKAVPTVRELIDQAAETYESKAFLKFRRNGVLEERSFRRTQQDALSFCRFIRNISTERMHIALISKSSYEYITCLTGILISGNVAIPFSPDISVKEAAMLFERGDVDLFLYEDAFSEKAEQLKKACPWLVGCVNIGDEESIEQIYADYGADSEYTELSDIQVDPEACAAIIFTSGTTGVRKGVMLSTNALVGNVMYEDYCKDIFRAGDIALSVLPMYHVYCFTGDYLKNLKDGLQVALNGDLRDIVQNLLIFEPRVIRVVPMIASTLLRRVKAIMSKNPDLSPNEAAKMVFGKNIRWLISGGAYLDPALIAEYDKLGIFLRQGYGMTEAGCRISVPDETVSMESVGRVIDICEARIFGGEIQVKTATAMLGYYNMPKETAAMFTHDGWLRTGDIGVLTEDRELFITGRVKNLIILSNGENVSPEAIEKKFNTNPLVREVMAYGERDKIVAEFFPDYAYAEENKIDDVQSSLENLVDAMNLTAKASHVISKVVVRSTPFERTATGKLIRAKNTI